MNLKDIQCKAIRLEDRQRIVNAALQSGLFVSPITIHDIKSDKFCWFGVKNFLTGLEATSRHSVSVDEYIQEIHKCIE